MVPIDEIVSFLCCYRRLIDSFRLGPETEKAQLAEILRRVTAPREPDPQPGRCRAVLPQ